MVRVEVRDLRRWPVAAGPRDRAERGKVLGQGIGPRRLRVASSIAGKRRAGKPELSCRPGRGGLPVFVPGCGRGGGLGLRQRCGGVLGRFAALSQYQRNGQRSPHKPLLVLLALGRLAQSGSSNLPLSAAEPALAELIAEFGPPSRTGSTRGDWGSSAQRREPGNHIDMGDGPARRDLRLSRPVGSTAQRQRAPQAGRSP